MVCTKNPIPKIPNGVILRLDFVIGITSYRWVRLNLNGKKEVAYEL
jgi:hypothetical protein